MKKKGLIHIYTGNGKGKTTAAVGLAIRAHARGLRPVWIQYCKDITRRPSGEILTFKKLNIPCYEFAPQTPLFQPKVDVKQLIKECAKSISFVEKLFKQDRFDLVILDEINVAISLRLIPVKKIIALLKKKPASMSVVLTGRGKHRSLVEIADLVTEMKEIKHPFNAGIPARKGIEF